MGQQPEWSLPTMDSRTVVDRPLAVVDAVNTASPLTYWVSVDHLNRPVQMFNAAKASVWQAVWQPWGGVQSVTGTATLNARFPGQWFQSETGLHYNWHRSYDPTLGRYTQPDPLGFVDGPSVYGYAGGSPHRFVDRDGRMSPGGAAAAGEFVCGPVCAVVGFAIAAYCLIPKKPDIYKNEPSNVPPSDVTIDDKIKDQLGPRNWTEKDVQDAVSGPAIGTTTDNRTPSKTADGQGRNDPATVYGTKDGYVVVNDRTKEVVQISGRNQPWIPDGRIKWK